jgi:SAM-dependent methyltransferase
LDGFFAGDLEEGIPEEAGGGYDLVLAADVLEHVRRPDRLLDDIRGRLAPNGSVITSVPNFGHWYPRLRVAAGVFDYDRRGVLDAGHLRFFTRRSFERLVQRTGFEVLRREAVGPPVEVLQRDASGPAERVGRLGALVQRVDSLGVALRPTLFAYQFLYELRPEAEQPEETLRAAPSGEPRVAVEASPRTA